MSKFRKRELNSAEVEKFKELLGLQFPFLSIPLRQIRLTSIFFAAYENRPVEIDNFYDSQSSIYEYEPPSEAYNGSVARFLADINATSFVVLNLMDRDQFKFLSDGVISNSLHDLINIYRFGDVIPTHVLFFDSLLSEQNEIRMEDCLGIISSVFDSDTFLYSKID